MESFELEITRAFNRHCNVHVLSDAFCVQRDDLPNFVSSFNGVWSRQRVRDALAYHEIEDLLIDVGAGLLRMFTNIIIRIHMITVSIILRIIISMLNITIILIRIFWQAFTGSTWCLSF